MSDDSEWEHRTRCTKSVSIAFAKEEDFEPWSEWSDGRGVTMYGNVQIARL